MTEGPFLDPSTMFDDVFAETPAHLESQRRRMMKLESINGDGSPEGGTSSGGGTP
jgi:hypothetical protein